MADDDEQLSFIISQLELHYEETDASKLLLRIEKIVLREEANIETDREPFEEIYVTFWAARERSSQGSEVSYELSKIC